MKSLNPSPILDAAPLTGEVLDPEQPPPTYEELAQFLIAHGRKPPRPPSYRSLDAALRAIVAQEVRNAAKYSP
jgi:hypothetical protein